ncbi:hypothetical protein H8356DRAFT_1401737, partial [Neocallimastix lanati (nom. inval.)]
FILYIIYYFFFFICNSTESRIEINSKYLNIPIYVFYNNTIKHKNELRNSNGHLNQQDINSAYICKGDKSTTLYNKCVNNFCTFNDESSIEYCNNIYKLFFFFYFEYSYIYCGKAPNDTFKKNKEYASKKCENGLCETLETFDMHKIRVNNEFYALI